MNRPALLTIIITTAAIAAVVWVWPEVGARPNGSKNKYLSVSDVTPSIMAQAKNSSAPFTVPTKMAVVAGVLPHHLLAAPLIQGWFGGLPSRQSPGTVVIIGPDHYLRAKSAAVTTNLGWSGPNGTVAVDGQLVTSLVAQKLVTFDESTIQREHSVYTVIPFVRQRWPRAKVVVIVLRPGTKDSTLYNQLGASLNKILGKNDLVLASVDLSHYQDAPTATAEDKITLDLLQNGDWSSVKSAPVDSPEALAVTMAYKKLRRANFQLIAHTNSAELTGDPSLTSTTSYLTAYFER